MQDDIDKLIPKEKEKVEDEKEKIFEGRYHYLKDGKRYSEEEFEVFTNDISTHYSYEAKTLTRLETGELLKTETKFHTDNRWLPLFVSIEKSLGPLKTTEFYVYDENGPNLNYRFDNGKESKEVVFRVPSKFHVSTPCFLCSMTFIQSLVFNVKGAEEMAMITSLNDWTYTSDPDLKIIFVEQKRGQNKEIELKGNTLPCVEYHLYRPAQQQNFPPTPIKIFLSKHVAIPYKAELGDGLTIMVDKLKKMKDDD